MDNIINVPKTGKDLEDRIGKNAKPLPLSQYTKPYLIEAYDNEELRPLCLAFNGGAPHGSVKNSSIVLATEVIKMAKKKGDGNIPNHAGRVAAALTHNRRKGGIGPKQLLLAAKGDDAAA
jgi:hypothetical protein